MIVHYQNRKGEEKMIRNVIHLQNIDNDKWEAVLANGESLTLRTRGIEGIYYKDLAKEGAE